MIGAKMTELTRTEKMETYHIWKRPLTEKRIELTIQYAEKHPGFIKATNEWSDLLCLRVETLQKIV